MVIQTEPDVNATISPVSAKGYTSSDRVTVTLVNPFCDKNGPITGYTVVVSLTTNPLPADEQLDTWREIQQSTMSQQLYAAIFHCADLFTVRTTVQTKWPALMMRGSSYCSMCVPTFRNFVINQQTLLYDDKIILALADASLQCELHALISFVILCVVRNLDTTIAADYNYAYISTLFFH